MQVVARRQSSRELSTLCEFRRRAWCLQYFHAKEINAKVTTLESHEIFRHDVAKRVEPGENWPAYGVDERTTDGWTEISGLGDTLTARASAIIDAAMKDRPIPSPPLPDGLVPNATRFVAVTLFDRGIIGRVLKRGDTLDDAIVRASLGAVADSRFARHLESGRRPAAVAVSLLHDPEELGVRTDAWTARRFRAGRTQ